MLMKLKMHLIKNRISQSKLAHQLGMYEPNLSKMVNGWKPMPDKVKKEICQLIKVGMEELFPEDENEGKNYKT